ncbi:MAG: hypothetical protein A3G76_03760 [Acidobacteria bacterium RIFCSPLOWO2_12_FULL_65_11]|nr:MAG: hypothetical protein A3H95_07435 [Acidobacteria bacterium RIFCSPLOWO2_02_FULL_64_15]OFW30042.1 MAG: hypothetical protein A3G76_03760 [Acidobacteria bacterium RIFCSPLOWO2_12_FULL_65_11]
MGPEKLAATAATAPIAWAQRLGYLLEHGGLGEKASGLKAHVRQHARQWAALLPAASRSRARRDEGWKLYVNADVKAEL